MFKFNLKITDEEKKLTKEEKIYNVAKTSGMLNLTIWFIIINILEVFTSSAFLYIVISLILLFTVYSKISEKIDTFFKDIIKDITNDEE